MAIQRTTTRNFMKFYNVKVGAGGVGQKLQQVKRPNNPSHPFGAEKLGLPSDLTYTVVPAYDQTDTSLKGSTWLDEAIQAQLRPVPCGRSLQCQ